MMCAISTDSHGDDEGVARASSHRLLPEAAAFSGEECWCGDDSPKESPAADVFSQQGEGRRRRRRRDDHRPPAERCEAAPRSSLNGDDEAQGRRILSSCCSRSPRARSAVRTRGSSSSSFVLATIWLMMVAGGPTTTQAQEFRSMTSRSCASTDPDLQASCFLLDDEAAVSDDDDDVEVATRSACWAACKTSDAIDGDLEASFALRDNVTHIATCCCAPLCSCLLDAPTRTLLALSTRLEVPSSCFDPDEDDPEEIDDFVSNGTVIADDPYEDREGGSIYEDGSDVRIGVQCGARDDLLLECFTGLGLDTPGKCAAHCFDPSRTFDDYKGNVTAAVSHVGELSDGRGLVQCCCYAACECVRESEYAGVPAWDVETVTVIRKEANIPYECGLGIDIEGNPDTRTYARVDCGDVGPSARGLRVDYNLNATVPSWRDACWAACDAFYVPEFGLQVASLSVPSEGVCWCYSECGCLRYIPNAADTTEGPEGRYLTVEYDLAPDDCGDPASGDPGPDDDPTSGGSIGDSPLDELEQLYTGTVGLRCGTEDIIPENTLCFYGLDYYETGDPAIWRYQCWAYCAHWYAASFGGALAAAFGDPLQGECCCATDCPCASPEPNHVMALALSSSSSSSDEGDDDDASPDASSSSARGSSDATYVGAAEPVDDDDTGASSPDSATGAAAEGSPSSSSATTTNATTLPAPLSGDDDDPGMFPPWCPTTEGNSKKKKKHVAAGVETSDLWWIILLAILGAVAVTFFLLVEEVDKHRRGENKKGSSKKNHNRGRSSSKNTTDVATPDAWLEDVDVDDSSDATTRDETKRGGFQDDSQDPHHHQNDDDDDDDDDDDVYDEDVYDDDDDGNNYGREQEDVGGHNHVVGA